MFFSPTVDKTPSPAEQVLDLTTSSVSSDDDSVLESLLKFTSQRGLANPNAVPTEPMKKDVTRHEDDMEEKDNSLPAAGDESQDHPQDQPIRKDATQDTPGVAATSKNKEEKTIQHKNIGLGVPTPQVEEKQSDQQESQSPPSNDHLGHNERMEVGVPTPRLEKNNQISKKQNGLAPTTNRKSQKIWKKREK